MPDYPIPDFVLDRAAERLAVGIRARTKTCVYDDCDLPATHWPATGSPACENHRSRPPVPTPDPTRTEPYLRRLRGSMHTPARTNFDNNVERKGQRVGAARRAELRDDTHGIAS
jgi:hypothetical protein